MFARPGVTGLALICGPVSGGVVVRDFDDMPAYERWATEHPDLAATLPTVQTARGCHIYFKSDHDCIKKIGDTGELRGAGYVLLPPSRHPSGTVYEWLNPLPDGELREIDPESAGLCNADVTPSVLQKYYDGDFINPSVEPSEKNPIESDRREQKITDDDRRQQKNGICSLLSDDDRCRIKNAIESTIPTRQGQRDDNVFQLCRSLKAIVDLKDASFHDLKPIVREWHQQALSIIGTKPFEDTWSAFVRGWGKVKYPQGEILAALLARADASADPAVAMQYDSPGMRRLVRLCRELQREAGTAPFFLLGRVAGRILDIGHDTAARWLTVLVADDVLELVEKGKLGRGTRYRYLPGLDA